MGLYVTPQDFTVEGLNCPVPVLEDRIAVWESFIEDLTGNIFSVYEPGELCFDGNNSRLLHFSIPLVEVTELKINDSSAALDTSLYRAHTGLRRPKDDRRNPKVELLNKSSVGIHYSSCPHIFVKGCDQKITAKWGFVEEDPENPGSYRTPRVILSVLKQLVLLDIKGYFSKVNGTGISLTPKVREKTDDHEIQYQTMDFTKVSTQAIPKNLYDTLMMYRAPRSMEVVGSDPYRSNFGPDIYRKNRIYGY